MSRDDYRDRDSRGRDDDRGRSRERDDDRGRSRDRDDDRGSRSRERDDDRGGRSRERDDDRDSRRSSSRGSSSFKYQKRDDEVMRKRGSQTANDFDRIFKDGVKMFKPADGVNRIRILPPTWEGADHYGHEIHVHYGVGPDRGSYLCLQKMLGKPDPIAEEHAELRRGGEDETAKKMDAKKRVALYLIDRDHEREGVQVWSMPWTVDRDIVLASTDRSSGEVLAIDHPEEGYDVTFEKKGSKDRTEYIGVQVARRSSPLGRNGDEWLDYITDNPLPDQFKFFDYDHIAKAFGAGAPHRDSRDRDDDRGRGRDDDRGGRSRERDRDDDRDRSKSAGDEPTWASVHEMTKRELEDLIDQERIKIDPREAESTEDLADWICDEMGLRKPTREREKEEVESRGRTREEDDPPRESRRRVREDDDDDRGNDRMRRMREERD